MLYQISQHPVEIKKIPLRIWSLRSEIEAAVTEKIQKAPETDSQVVVQELQALYSTVSPIAPQADEKEMKDDSRGIPPEGQSVFGFAFLSDIYMNEMLLFSQSEFSRGQSIMIEFLIPFSVKLSAEVIQSRNIAMGSRIISPQRPGHRIQLRLLHQWPNERGRLRTFLESIAPDLPAAKGKKMGEAKAADKKSDDDDEFNLDDLGLE